MAVQSVINAIRWGVRLVISNTKLAVAAQQLQQGLRNPRVVSVENPNVPGTLLLPIDRREAVDGDDLRCRAARNSLFYDCIERAMIRLVNRLNAPHAVRR